jgi:hypothetical protein
MDEGQLSFVVVDGNLFGLFRQLIFFAGAKKVSNATS